MRLLISNYRNNVKSLDANKNEDEKFFLSFTHNLFLRKGMSIILFFLYKEVIFNESDTVRYVRSQYFIEDALLIIAEKSDLIEDIFDFLYEYIKNFLENNKKKYDIGIINNQDLLKVLNDLRIYMYDSKYLSKPKLNN